MTDAPPPMSWSDFAALPPAPGGERIAWGSGPRDFGLLRTPDGEGPHPVALLVHGGCWSSEAGPDYLGRFAAWLAEVGWASWSVAFPRTDDPGGGWPGTLAGVGVAADRLRELAASRPLDMSRVVAVGHSSGAHLALWLAARPMLPREAEGGRVRGSAPIEVSGVIALAPITSIASFHAEGAYGCDDDSVEALLGGLPVEVPDRVAVADPLRLLPLRVPQLIVTGSLDETVPPIQAVAYARQARLAGDDVACLELATAGHFEVVAPAWSGWIDVEESMLDFLSRVGA